MAKHIYAYIAVGLLGLALILAIAAASLPSFFETSTTANTDSTKTKFELGPFKTCLNVANKQGESSSCEQSGTNCRIISLSRDHTIQYGYDGSCGYYNSARGFLLLGIFGCIGAICLLMFTLLRKSGPQYSTLFYALCISACAFIAMCFIISFASVVAFEKDVHDSFLQTTKPKELFVNPTTYGASFTWISFVSWFL
jgi:hypothetical protein